MPFWGAQLGVPEPKRAYRFIVPFPVYVPKKQYIAGGIQPDKSQSLISDLVGAGPAALNLTNEYGKNKYFEFLAVSCTKPSVQTEIFKVSPGGAASHPLVRPGQSTKYEFAPVKIELIDTYAHDIASTLTAYLYAYAKINTGDGHIEVEGDTAAVMAANWTPGKLIPFHNTSTDKEFHIYEILADIPVEHPLAVPPAGRSFAGTGADPGADGGQAAIKQLRQMSARARRWILRNPYISKIDFGTYNHGGDELSKVTIELVYDRYDYDFVLHESYVGVDMTPPQPVVESPGPETDEEADETLQGLHDEDPAVPGEGEDEETYIEGREDLEDLENVGLEDESPAPFIEGREEQEALENIGQTDEDIDWDDDTGPGQAPPELEPEPDTSFETGTPEGTARQEADNDLPGLLVPEEGLPDAPEPEPTHGQPRDSGEPTASGSEIVPGTGGMTQDQVDEAFGRTDDYQETLPGQGSGGSLADQATQESLGGELGGDAAAQSQDPAPAPAQSQGDGGRRTINGQEVTEEQWNESRAEDARFREGNEDPFEELEDNTGNASQPASDPGPTPAPEPSPGPQESAPAEEAPEPGSAAAMQGLQTDDQVRAAGGSHAEQRAAHQAYLAAQGYAPDVLESAMRAWDRNHPAT